MPRQQLRYGSENEVRVKGRKRLLLPLSLHHWVEIYATLVGLEMYFTPAGNMHYNLKVQSLDMCIVEKNCCENFCFCINEFSKRRKFRNVKWFFLNLVESTMQFKAPVKPHECKEKIAPANLYSCRHRFALLHSMRCLACYLIFKMCH